VGLHQGLLLAAEDEILGTEEIKAVDAAVAEEGLGHF